MTVITRTVGGQSVQQRHKLIQIRVHANGLKEEKEKIEEEVDKLKSDKDKCEECIKRAEVETSQNKIIDTRENEIEDLKKNLKAVKDRNIAILKECKTKKRVTKENEKEIMKLGRKVANWS